jgi:hypothetical protein
VMTAAAGSGTLRPGRPDHRRAGHGARADKE